MTASGIPTKHTDAAWDELQEPTDGVIQASYETGFDVDNLVKTIQSNLVPGLYMYGLEVYHQLHCLDYVRRSFHPAHYFPNSTEHEINHHRGTWIL